MLRAGRINLSSAVLSDIAPLRRKLEGGIRPPEGAAFDDRTVICDVFRSCDKRAVVLLGPTPNNVEPWLKDVIREAFPGRAAPAWFVNDRHFKSETRSRANAIDFPAWVAPQRLEVQPNFCELFAGRRAIFTQSKDNPLEWIADWATFHAAAHGCDAVLLYDNASTAYDLDALEAVLLRVPGIAVVAVVSWPFHSGTPGVTTFSQRVMFEHAHRRFLMRARSVLNTDIGELAVTGSGRSVFEVVEQSTTGYILGKGRYVTAPTGGDGKRGDGKRGGGKLKRHRNFLYRGREPISRPKWAVALDRCPEPAVWGVHNVDPMVSDPGAAADFQFRRFALVDTDRELDEELLRWMERVPWLEF
jgi:hypothetical protein